jgi:hypothetical protein
MFFHSVTPSFTPIKTRVKWCEDTKLKMQQRLPDKKKTVWRQTDRQTDMQAGRQARQAGRQAGRQARRQAGRQAGRPAGTSFHTEL